MRLCGGHRWHMFRMPVPYQAQSGPQKGVNLNLQGYDRLLDDYYKSRGWDRNGIPESTTLQKLGLEDIAQALGKLGN